MVGANLMWLLHPRSRPVLNSVQLKESLGTRKSSLNQDQKWRPTDFFVINPIKHKPKVHFSHFFFIQNASNELTIDFVGIRAVN